MFVETLAPINVLPELPAGHPLTSAWAKFARGREHYGALRSVAHEIIEATFANGVLEPVPVRPGWVSVRARLAPIPIRTSCIVGDIMHELRTALDHVAFALARARGFAGNFKQVQFPLAVDVTSFNKRRVGFVEMFGAAAVAAIEQMQPYYERPGLQWLQDLNNVDKHEAVVLTRPHLTITGVSIRDPRGQRPMLASDGPVGSAIIADGDEVCQIAHEGDTLAGVHFSLRIAASLGIRAAPGRVWPAERLDLILRQVFVDVEETLLVMRSLF